MDLSSTKQRHILFYGSKDDGPFVGHESGHEPPRPGNTVPPDHSPLVMDLTGYERSGQGFATQNFSVRVTGRQTEATILVFFRWNGDLGSFSVADGQVWMAEHGRQAKSDKGEREKRRGLFTA